MPLNLKELIQKAEKKGIKPYTETSTSKKFLKSWQQESIIFNQTDTTIKDKIKPIKKNAETKQKQTVSNALAEPLAMRENTVSNALANREQSVSNALAEPLAIPLAMREDSVSKPLAIREHNVSNALATNQLSSIKNIDILVGKERALLQLLFQKCQSIGSLETQAITTEELRKALVISAEHLRNIIYRLTNKGFIEKIFVKNGKSGWRKFYLSKEIFQSFVLNSSVSNALVMRENTVSNALANREQSVSTALADPLAEPLASTASSSYNNIILTTTSDEEILKKWSLDIEPLSKIGFTKTHLEQIYSQKKLEPEVVQDSIYAFAFDLEENKKAGGIKGAPLNFFMGILRNGKPYAPPANYESPTDKAMRMYLEQKERLRKQREEIEERSCNLAFEEWFIALPVEEKKKYNLRGAQFNPDSSILKNIAFSEFKANIWKNIKNKIINSGG